MQVDINALRDHLVDMDNVTTKATVERSIGELSVTFSVAGDDATGQSIQRMILAHSMMPQKATGWTVHAKEG
jgi:hypothetical protein